MDVQNNIEQIISLFESGDTTYICPKFDQFNLVLKQVEDSTFLPIMQLLNLAVGCMEQEEVYCEIGCFQGENLIAALLGNSDSMAYAVDDYSKYPDSQAQYDKLVESLYAFNLQEQVLICNQSVEAFFFELKEAGITDKIGIYADLGSHDYKTQLISLLLAKSFLSDTALIIVGQTNSIVVGQAVKDFIKTHPGCHLLLDLPDFSSLNGLSILCWDSANTFQIDSKGFRACLQTTMSDSDPPQPPLKRGENSVQVPLNKGENSVQVPLFKGDLGGSPDLQTGPSLQTSEFQPMMYGVHGATPVCKLLIYTRTTHTICKLVRVLEPDYFSATLPGVRTVQTLDEIDVNIAQPDEAKVFIWQRPFLDYVLETEQWMVTNKTLRQAGYLVVVELDDTPLAWPEAVQTSFFEFLRTCHGVQTSTQPLADYLRPFNPNVVVFPNQLAFLPPPRTPAADDPVTLFFGAQNRESDWAPIIVALNRVLLECGDRIQVQVIHDQRFFDALETDQKQFEPWCPYSRYQQILRSCDIGLLPLELSEFNQMKSDLKFIECAAHGVVALASPTVYAQSIIEGQTGLIYHSVEDFTVKLHELIVNREMRCQIARQAYDWVRNYRLLSQHYYQRRDWYLQMIDRLGFYPSRQHEQ